MDKTDDTMLVVIPVNEPRPVAYLNVYEPGDKWVKTVGCEQCPVERRRRCCGNCPMASDDGCFWHLEKRIDGGNKPFHCIVNPRPSTCKKGCMLEFTCVRGSKKGLTRRVNDVGDTFVENQGTTR